MNEPRHHLIRNPATGDIELTIRKRSGDAVVVDLTETEAVELRNDLTLLVGAARQIPSFEDQGDRDYRAMVELHRPEAQR